jgi:ATP-dependent DNA helicase RecG
LPEISSEYDAFTVKIFSDVISKETAEAMSQVVYHYQQLRQKDIITLGVIAQEQKISALHLTSKLQLEKDERLRAWVSRLLEIGLIKKRGSKRATEYLLNQDFFNKIGKDIKTTLKTVEPHVLRDLILEDLKRHPLSTIRNIQERLKDLSINEIRKILINLREEGLIEQSGGRKFRKYSLA